MQLVNLDKITTRRDKVIILGGVEHVMHTPTVKDYIEQMKRADEISSLTLEDNAESVTKVLDLTIETLMRAFPTITREQFEALTFEQLNALRTLAEDNSDAEATDLKEAHAGEAVRETE